MTMLLRILRHYKSRSLPVASRRARRRAIFSQKTSEPLRILFCGSDDFSITSLKAVHEEHKRDSDSIASIDVVCRPAKRVGRGLKTLREVPIAEVARNLFLPLHEVDTFTGWTPPTPQGSPINLVIAVSFGRLVPPRILNGAKYGGLNVHPSMLPDFHGPAPIHHTLLSNCSRTGSTLQTMHPQYFDQGVILDQTPFPGLEHNCTTFPELSSKMAPLGAEMLVRAIKERTFVPPYEAQGWAQAGHGGLTRPAPKITAEDSHIDWARWTSEEILRKQNIVGPLWNTVHQFDSKKGETRPRRVIWSSGFSKASTADIDLTQGPGRPYSMQDDPQFSIACVNTADYHMLQAEKVTLDGARERTGRAALASLLVGQWVRGIEGTQARAERLWLK